jgi:hypothetical protein
MCQQHHIQQSVVDNKQSTRISTVIGHQHGMAPSASASQAVVQLISAPHTIIGCAQILLQ